jgi:small-conductance mechanosensitive channel
MGVASSLEKLVLAVIALFVLAWAAIFALDLLASSQASFAVNFGEAAKVAILLGAGGLAVYLMRRFNKTLAGYTGHHMASLITFFMIILACIGTLFGILNTLHVPSDTLLLGGGVVSIVVGLLVSTLFGNVISGGLMLTTFPFKVGDGVLVNNIPGRIEEITTLYTRISNNSGSETIIPNSAIVQGSVSLSKLTSDGAELASRLHYSVGDRVYTTYIGGEGVVAEITPFHTKVILDSNREAVIPNTAVFSGSVQIARVRKQQASSLSFSFKVEWDAEKTIEAVKNVKAGQGVFRSPVNVSYASLEGRMVELKVDCEVDPDRRDEARGIILRAAYLVSSSETR